MAESYGVHVGDGVQELVDDDLQILFFKHFDLVIYLSESGVLIVLHDQVGLVVGSGNVEWFVLDNVRMRQVFDNIVGVLHVLNVLRLAFGSFYNIAVRIVLLHAFVDHPTGPVSQNLL